VTEVKKKNVFSALKALAQTPWLQVNPLSLINGNKAVIGVNVGHLWEDKEKVYSWCQEILNG